MFSLEEQKMIEECINQPERYYFIICNEYVFIKDKESAKDSFDFTFKPIGDDFIRDILEHMGCAVEKI